MKHGNSEVDQRFELRSPNTETPELISMLKKIFLRVRNTFKFLSSFFFEEMQVGFHAVVKKSESHMPEESRSIYMSKELQPRRAQRTQEGSGCGWRAVSGSVGAPREALQSLILSAKTAAENRPRQEPIWNIPKL